MPTKLIRLPEHVDALSEILKSRKFPMTVSWTQGAPQSEAQRRLSFRWYQDVARQLGDRDSGDVRAEAKVMFGAPILCDDSEPFKMSWEALRARFQHEEIVAFVKATELPVTSIMLLPQMSKYMTTIGDYWRGQGIYLTDPEALKYEFEFEPQA